MLHNVHAESAVNASHRGGQEWSDENFGLHCWGRPSTALEELLRCSHVLPLRLAVIL